MVKQSVRSFWNASPCGSNRVQVEPGSLQFFMAVEVYRYATEPHIPEMASFAASRGRRVLEVGCGLGTDGARFAQEGADYLGVDASANSVDMAVRNFLLRGLPGKFCVTDGEILPFPDETFDIVYSNGVLHHTPDTGRAVREIHRVLKPGGRAIVMLYHKNSLNYYLGIMGLRRLGALALCLPHSVDLLSKMTGESSERLRTHRAMMSAHGLSYLTSPLWLSYNTDGAGNPLSKVYSPGEALYMFRDFASASTQVRHANTTWLPVVHKLLPRRVDGLLGRVAGWHLYVLAQK